MFSRNSHLVCYRHHVAVVWDHDKVIGWSRGLVYIDNPVGDAEGNNITIDLVYMESDCGLVLL